MTGWEKALYEYEGLRRVAYGDEGATFVPVCPKCGRFVKADNTIQGVDRPNATCAKCGRVTMLFEGYI